MSKRLHEEKYISAKLHILDSSEDNCFSCFYILFRCSHALNVIRKLTDFQTVFSLFTEICENLVTLLLFAYKHINET